MQEPIQRRYRDRLFVKIFSDKEKLLPLYNAINGTDYKTTEGMDVNTIDDVIYMTMRNDVSFVFQGSLSLYEQQSTYNPNMPLRGLLYFSRFYQKYADSYRIYGTKTLRIPAPRFVVFYNGSKEAADCVKLRLSDMFEVPIPAGEFEWTATMLNINYGRNKKLMEQSKALRDYSMYVKLVEDNKKTHGDIREAVTAAVNEAIRLDLLDGYFRKCKEDAIMDCLTEFDMDEYKKFLRQEAQEELAEAQAQHRADQACIAERDTRIAELEAENEALRAQLSAN